MAKVKTSDIPRRLATITIGAPIVLILLTNELVSYALLQIVHSLCCYEWIKSLVPVTTRTTGAPTFHSALWLFPPASLLLASCSSENLLLYLAASSGIFTLICVAYKDHKHAHEHTHQLILGHIQQGFLFLTLGFHHLLSISHESLAHSLFFCLVVWNCDTGALVFGRLGKLVHDDILAAVFFNSRGRFITVMKVLSPAKTVTGFAGGIFFGTITAALLPSLLVDYLLPALAVYAKDDADGTGTEQDVFQFECLADIIPPVAIRRIFVGVSLSFAGIIGDLVESSVKRNAAVKDSGKLIPGHGGLMDRMDSMLIASGVYYWVFIMR